MSSLPDPAPQRRRVIHFDPASAAAEAAGHPPGRGPGGGDPGSRRERRFPWGRIVGILFLLFVAWFGWRVWIVVIEPGLVDRREAARAADPAIAPRGATPSDRLATAARVARARQEADEAVQAVRRIPADHPVLTGRLLDFDRGLGEGDRRSAAGDLPGALAQFEHVISLAGDFRIAADLLRTAREREETFLDRLAAAETSSRFAPRDYEAALARAAVAKTDLEAGRFGPAATAFLDAATSLDAVAKAAEAWVAARRVEGLRALAAGEGEAATAAFDAILALRPGDASAASGRLRAPKAAEVRRLIIAGEEAEGRGDLDAAFGRFQEARALDPASVAAQQALSRVGTARDERRWQALLATAEAAAARGDWDAALAEWDRAAREFPSKAETIRANREAVAGRSFVARRAEAYTRAVDLERKLDWVAARNAYQAVLDLDRTFQPAVDGLVRTGEVLRAIIRYERLAAESLDLARRGEYPSAVRTFNQAMASKPDYLGLTPALAALRRELEAQSQPVPIRFTSDERTYVSIVGFKLIGQFKEKTDSILPGNYTVRGRRRGYRDVTFTLRVRAGEPLAPVNVVCVEKIPNT